MLSFNRAHGKQLVAQRDVGKGGEFSSNALGHCELLVLAVLLTSGDKYKHRHLYLLYLFILTVLSAGSAFISMQVRWSIIAVPLSLNPLQYRKQRKRLVAMGGGQGFPHYLNLYRCLSVCSGSLAVSSRFCRPTLVDVQCHPDPLRPLDTRPRAHLNSPWIIRSSA